MHFLPFYPILLYISGRLLRLISIIFQRIHNFILMLRAKSFHCDLEFHRRVPVGGHKLVMFELDHIAVLLRDNACHTAQFTRLIRQKHRYGKNPVPEDQPLLYYRRHGDHIHIAAA